MVLLWVPPFGPTLANVFMCHFENIWLENCPTHFKPVVYIRYVEQNVNGTKGFTVISRH